MSSLDPNSNSNSYFSPINPNNNNNNNNYFNFPNLNWNWLVQFLITTLILGLGFLHFLRSTASKYFAVDSPTFSLSSTMPAAAATGSKEGCAACGEATTTRCSACKTVYYCSRTCQSVHWKSEHKTNCKGSSGRLKLQQHKGGKPNSFIALAPSSAARLVDKVLFPYDEFVKLFNCNTQAFAPCGLLNCGNSCFANVVLQCLAHTQPLVAYLLKKGHRRDCRRNKWCFLCELERHMDRATISQQPFSPINILSRLPTMGGNMGDGKQEDAHEFMRFAIDMMQSVCLDEHGGEKFILPKSQETSLIQYIFGGQLRSQVECKRCNQVSNQYENMMDLAVEIQGDATSLEECLNQFTAEECLDGENKYKCDRCKDYVIARKRLTIHQAPNILTVALKRFEGGIFGKINKKITFPESLVLSPYMSEEKDGTDKYELYAVVVHVDMLNASFFGHYICYAKGFQGDWYWIDDCKVTRVDLDEVLSQGAYMLLYRRISARPKCPETSEAAVKDCEGVNMATVADNSPLSQLASSSNSLEPSCSNRTSMSDQPSEGTVSKPASDKEQLLNIVQDPVEHSLRVELEPGCGTMEDSRAINQLSGLRGSGSVEVLRNNLNASRSLTTPTCSSDQPSCEVAGVLRASSTGSNAPHGDTICESSGAVADQETVGSLDEHMSEDEPHVVINAENSDVAPIDQTASELSCSGNAPGQIGKRNGKTEKDDHSLLHGETNTFLDDVEVSSVELDEPANGSDDVGHGMEVDNTPVNT